MKLGIWLGIICWILLFMAIAYSEPSTDGYTEDGEWVSIEAPQEGYKEVWVINNETMEIKEITPDRESPEEIEYLDMDSGEIEIIYKNGD